MTFFDLVCGCRMHLAFMVLCGLLDDFFFGFGEFVVVLVLSFCFIIDLLDMFVMSNRLFYLRLRGLHFFDIFDIMFMSLSGVLSRSVGVCTDIRLITSYEVYFLLTFDYIVSFLGDCCDRFLVRLFDLRMSLLILKQLFFCVFFVFGYMCLFDYFYMDMTIETIISMFYSLWVVLLPGLTCAYVEHPKGEYCLFIAFCGFGIHRMRIRCCDFIHICLLDYMVRGFMLHDLVALLGNLDVVFGSVDR